MYRFKNVENRFLKMLRMEFKNGESSFKIDVTLLKSDITTLLKSEENFSN